MPVSAQHMTALVVEATTRSTTSSNGAIRASGKGTPIGAGLPALVSYSDPTDVEVLWDELLSVKEQGRQTADEAIQAANERMAEATEAVTRGLAQGWPAPPASAPTDPATHEMLRAQYRAAGIEIDGED